MHALNTKQRLQAVEQEILDAWHHLALDSGALDVTQQVDDSQLMQEVEEVIQQGPFVQSIDPIDDLLAVQAPRHPCVITTSGPPTQPLGQVLIDLFSCLCHGPPPSSADWCSPYSGKRAREQAVSLYSNFSFYTVLNEHLTRK